MPGHRARALGKPANRLNDFMTIRIQITPEVARFNRAVLRADELSGHRFDRCDADWLIAWLRAAGFGADARELELSQMDLPREPLGE